MGLGPFRVLGFGPGVSWGCGGILGVCGGGASGFRAYGADGPPVFLCASARPPCGSATEPSPVKGLEIKDGKEEPKNEKGQ